MGTLEPIKGQIEYSADVRAVDKAVQSLEVLSKASADVAKALGAMDPGKAAAGLDGLARGAKNADGAVVGTADKLRKLGQGFKELKDFGAATIGKAIGEYERFNTSMGQVATLSTEVQQRIGEAEQATLSLSRSLGLDATAAADAFYQSLSASVRGATDMDGALRFMGDAGKAAVAGNLDLKTSVDGISTALNAWGQDASHATEASDILFTAVAKGKTTFREMSANLFQVGPIAANTGVSLQNVAGATATLTKSGTPTSVVMTQLKAVLTELNKPSAGVATSLQAMADKGLIAEATGHALVEAYGGNLPNALQALRDNAAEAGVSYGALFGSVEASSAVLGLTGDNLATASADLEAMGNSAGATADAYEVMTNTFGFQSNQLKASTQSAFIEVGKVVGQVLVPFMQKLNEVIASGLEHWNALGDQTKRFIVTFALMAGTLAPLVLGFLKFQGTLSAASQGAGMLQGAMKLLSASMLTNPVTLVILGIAAAAAALIVGIQGLNAEVRNQQQTLGKAHADLGEFSKGIELADENATGLAGALGGVRDFVRDIGLRESTADVRESANAWLQYSVGVDEAVLKSKAYKQEKAQLDQQLAAGKITLDQYKEGLLEAADAASYAAGTGRVLTQEQQKVAQAFTDSQGAILARKGAVGEALLADEQYKTTVQSLAELVGQGKLSQQEAATAINHYVGERTTQVAADLEAAQAAATASGALYEYSAGFAALTEAGSQWSVDQKAITEGMAELQGTLESKVKDSLQGLWDARKQYGDNLAEAAAADAAAQAQAQEDIASGAAAHAAKMAELQGKQAEAGGDEGKSAKIAEQIAAEQQRWDTLNAIAAEGSGSQTEKVRAAYAEQVQLTREALAQTVVDFVNGQVLLGQTSEETAKQIFSTLRGAFPDVEVFSPVQDAYAGLMAGISSATQGSEADIARLPGLIQAIPDTMEASAAEANATLDSWGQDYNLLAQSAETAAGTIAAKDVELAGSATSRASVVAGSNAAQRDSLVELEATTAGSTAAIMAHNEGTVGSAGARAAGVAAALGQERDELTQTASVSTTTGRSMQGDYQQTASDARTMADVTVSSAGRITGGLDGLASGVRTSAQTIGTEYEGAAGRFSSAQQTLVGEIGRADVAFSTSGGTARTYAGQVAEAGDTIETALGGGADAAVDTGRAADRGLGDAADAAIQAGEQTVTLREELEALPTEVTIPLTLEGVEAAIKGVTQLTGYLAQMPKRVDVEIATTHVAKDKATEVTPSLHLFHWIQDGVEYAASNPVVVQSSYVSGSVLLTPGSSGGLAFSDAYSHALQLTQDRPITVTATMGDGTDAYLRAGADRNKLLYQEQLESLLRTIEAFGTANVDPETMAELARAMAAGDLERSYQKAREALDQLKDSEDKRYRDEIKRLETLRDAETERIEAAIEAAGDNETEAERLREQLDDHKDAYADLIDAEKDRHDVASSGLAAQADAMGKYYERIGDYEDELEDRQKARIDAALEEAERYYDSLEDYENELADEVDRLLDEREQAAEDAYGRELDRIQGLEDAEAARYQAAKDAVQLLVDAVKDEQETADRALEDMANSLKRLELDLNLDDTKDQIDGIRDALKDLPSLTEKDPRKRSKKFGIEDVGGDDTRAALERALAEGKVRDSDRKTVEALLGGRKIAGTELREILERIQGGLEDQLEAGEAVVDQRRRELEYAKLAADEDKRAREDRLKDLGEQQKAVEKVHTDELGRINAQKEAAKDKLDQDKEGIEDLRKLEDERHKARLAQIAQQAAMQKALLEGKSEAEIRAEIEAAVKLAEKARADAAALIQELERQRQAAQPLPPPYAIPPGTPLPPPAPPPILPPGAEPSAGGAQTDAAEAAVRDGVVAGMLEALRQLTPSSPGMGTADSLASALGSAAGIVGPAVMSVYNTFYGDIFVGDVAELQTLLRNTLGP